MIGAVDIGGTKIAAGIVDDNGKVLSRMEGPTDRRTVTPKGSNGSRTCCARPRSEPESSVPALGSDQPGQSTLCAESLATSIFCRAGVVRVRSRTLAQIFNVRVALENDGDAAALAESGWGAGRNRSRLIYLTVGTGIGGGIVLDGKLYRGVDGAHPEVGHQVLDPAGPPCSCGFHGCWESLAAGPAMVAWLAGNMPAGYPHREGITAQRICELARREMNSPCRPSNVRPTTWVWASPI